MVQEEQSFDLFQLCFLKLKPVNNNWLMWDSKLCFVPAVGCPESLLPQALEQVFLILSIGELQSSQLLAALVHWYSATISSGTVFSSIIHWFRWDGELWSVPTVGCPGFVLPHPPGRGHGLVHQARLKSLDKLAKTTLKVLTDHSNWEERLDSFHQ